MTQRESQYLFEKNMDSRSKNAFNSEFIIAQTIRWCNRAIRELPLGFDRFVMQKAVGTQGICAAGEKESFS